MANTQITAPSLMFGTATPNDGTDLGICRAISFGGAGSLVLTDLDGNDRTIPSGALATGIMHPICYQRVKAASTATNIMWYK